MENKKFLCDLCGYILTLACELQGGEGGHMKIVLIKKFRFAKRRPDIQIVRPNRGIALSLAVQLYVE